MKIQPENVKTISDAAMYFKSEYSDVFTEAYQVGHAIEVVIETKNDGHRIFKIEPVKSIGDGPRNYDVHVYEKIDIVQDAKTKQRFQGWVFFTFASCNRDDEVSVMMQALSFMWDAFRHE